AVNWDLGFGQVTKYILFGPPGTMSLYQPVDLMDLTVNARAWDRLTPQMQQFVEEQVYAYSLHHYVTIQKRNMAAMDEFLKSGSEVSRLSGADVIEFRKAAIPIWFEWANKDADAKRVFDLKLNYMKNEIMGYVTEADLAGLS
ncbi:MAG: ABC transporter substrate-binding protein, partial [Thiohalocapsa sp.]